MYIKTALLVLASACVAAAQDVPPTPLDSTTMASAEQAAARIALDSSFIRTGATVAINPMFIPVGVAGPAETRDLALRPVPRTDRLAAFLKAAAKERDQVVTCASRTSLGPRCDMLGADVYLSISQPRFEGGLATVTVTIEAQGTKGSLAYETMSIVMANTNAGWKAMKIERLGRS